MPPTFDSLYTPQMEQLVAEGKVIVMIQPVEETISEMTDDGPKRRRVRRLIPRYVDNDPKTIQTKKRQGFVEAEPVQETTTRWVVREKVAEAPKAPSVPKGKE